MVVDRSLDVRTGGDRPDLAQRARVVWRRHGPAALGYALLTVVTLWPAIVRFRTTPMVDGVDAAMFEWLWWAMPRSVAEGRDPFATDLMFHPVGADLALTTSAPLLSALTLPIQLLFGPAAQINAVQLASMFTAGLCTYLLAVRVCGHRGASFVAGVAFALLPHRFAHVDSHPNLIATGILPFGVLAFLRFVEAPTSRRAVALGVTCGAAALIDPQLLVLLVACLVPLALIHRAALRAAASRSLLAAGTAVVVAAPLLGPMAVALAAGQAADPAPTAAALRYSASPLSWVVPPTDRLALGQVVSVPSIVHSTEGIAFVGLVVLGLALGGRRLVSAAERRPWVSIALVGVVLSLGPYPFVGGAYVRVPLPFFLVQALPGLDTMRVPGRFALVGALGLVVLAAQALAALTRARPDRASLVLVVAGTLLVLELFPGSLPERPGPTPEVYDAIAEHSGSGAVLELPLKWSTTQGYFGYETTPKRDFMFLVHATRHGRPVASGAVSRFDDDRLDGLRSIPLYRQLLAASGEPGFDDALDFDADALADLGIGFVVYHRDDPMPDVLAHIRSLDLEVLADDGVVIVWVVPV